MNTNFDKSPMLSTVSFAFLQDWLLALENSNDSAQIAIWLGQSGIGPMQGIDRGRISHDQFVRLYQLAAVGSGDEMMGLWSRPIRAGALKQLCTVMMGASSLGGAIFRFTTFWNLVLDDYELRLSEDDQRMRVHVIPREGAQLNRFGQMLLLKLTHGIASWLAGQELPLVSIGFGFDRPSFAEDYAILFPGPVQFNRPHSVISFERSASRRPISRTDAELQDFLRRAPRDWIFTTYKEHSLPLQVRALMSVSDEGGADLASVSAALNMTPRTLIRRLKADGTSFQAIKDGLRRDIAIRALTQKTTPIQALAQDVGFSSVATFHRAFKRWTGQTPAHYRDSQLLK